MAWAWVHACVCVCMRVCVFIKVMPHILQRTTGQAAHIHYLTQFSLQPHFTDGEVEAPAFIWMGGSKLLPAGPTLASVHLGI